MCQQGLIKGNQLSRDKASRSAALAELEKSEQYAFVQFHPAYTYEDFVRGIKAISVDGKIAYETENRILATFAANAATDIGIEGAATFESWWAEYFSAFVQHVNDTMAANDSRYPLHGDIYIYKVEAATFPVPFAKFCGTRKSEL